MPHKQAIKQFLLENFLFTDDTSALDDAQSLIRSGILDSTGIHELVVHLEQTYGLSIEPQEMLPANFETVDAVDAFVSRKLAA